MDMTDLEMTRLCAKAMGIKVQLIAEPEFHFSDCPYYSIPYPSEAPNARCDPLHDDEQAFAALVYLLSSGVRVVIENNAMQGKHYGKRPIMMVEDKIYEIETPEKFRRAIVECVANMQKAKA